MNSKSRGLSFRHKILLLLATSIIALTLGIALATWRSLNKASHVIGRESRSILSGRTGIFLEKLVKERAVGLDVQLEQARAAARNGAVFISQNPSRYEWNRTLTENLLSTLCRGADYCTAAWFVPADGEIWSHPPMDPALKLSPAFDITRESYFPKISRLRGPPEEVAWSLVHRNPLSVNYDLVVDAVSPVVALGALRGWVGVSVSLTRMIARFNQFQPVRGGYSFLIDVQRRLVGAPPHARVELSSGAAWQSRGVIDLGRSGNDELDRVLRKMILGESAIMEVHFNNEPKYIAYHPLENIDWRLGIVVPVRMAEAASGQLVDIVETGIRRALWGMLYWAGGFLVLSLIAGIMLARHLTSPILGLSAVTGRIAKGNFEGRVEISRPDEMGALAMAFNTMSDKIHAMLTDLNDVNRRLNLKNSELEKQIQEKKRAEDAIERAWSELNIVFNAMGDGMLVIGGDFRILRANKAFSALCGLDNDKVVGAFCHDVFPGDACHGPNCSLARVLGGETHFEHETVKVRRDGVRTPCIVTAAPFWGRGGELSGIVANFKDITVRKRDEEELRSLRNLFGAIVNSMPSVLVGVDFEGRVTQWNREAEMLTNVTADRAQGRLLADVFPRLAKRMPTVRQAIRGREAISEEKARRVQDGETRHEDITIYPLMDHGVEGAVIRVDDVTDRVRIEEMMIQTEKMMSVGGLAAGMAHEINNPLGGILQNAQNVLRRVSPELEKNVRAARECGVELETIRVYLGKRGIFRFMESIREAGIRAARIVSNMLQFSRPGSSRKQSVPLPSLTDRTLELAASDYNLKKKYDFKHIEVVREYAPDLPAVFCVESEITQVLLNLLKNAAQAMEKEEPRGEAQRIILRVLRDGRMARIEVEDNGPGMDETIRKRVFEPFFTTKGPASGTGLGLSVSYFIIKENHGGEMAVESSPGHGAKFIIRLPFDRRSGGGDQRSENRGSHYPE